MRRDLVGRSLGIAALLLALLTVPSAAESAVDFPPGPLLADPSPTWGAPSQLSPASFGTAFDAQVAVGRGGNAVAVWLQRWEEATWSWSVFASRFSPDSGWGVVFDIAGTIDAGPSVTPQGLVPVADVAMSPTGSLNMFAAKGWEYDSIAVWQQGTDLYANHLGPGDTRREPQVIGSTADGAAHAEIVMDAAGNAIVVWGVPTYRTPTFVTARRFSPARGWEAPLRLDISGSSPAIAMNANGDAIVVWNSMRTPGPGVYAIRYTPGLGWGQPEYISTHAVPPEANPSVALDPGGAAAVVWLEVTGYDFGNWRNPRYGVYASYADRGSGWGPSQLVSNETTAEYYPSPPRVAMDASGDALVVWGSSGRLHSRRLVPVGEWEDPIELVPWGAWDAQLAMEANGNATVVFHGSGDFPWTMQFHPGTGWGQRETVGPPGIDPQVAMDPDGTVTVVWTRGWGPPGTVATNRRVAGGAWGEATEIETDLGPPRNPRVAADPSGSAFAVWQQGRGIFGSRFVPRTGWSPAEVLGYGHSPQVTIGAGGGTALVVWQFEGSIFGRLYTGSWGPREVVGEGTLCSGDEWPPCASAGLSDRGGIAVFRRWDVDHEGVYAARRFAGSWQLEQIGSAPSVSNPSLIMDENGSAIAIWRQDDGTSSSVRADIFDPEAGWLGVQEVDGGPSLSFVPRMAMDADGNAIVVWAKQGSIGQTGLYARRYVRGVGWGQTNALSTAGVPWTYLVAASARGGALVVWSADDEALSAQWFDPRTGWKGTERIPAVGWPTELGVDAGGRALVVSLRCEDGLCDVHATHFSPVSGWAPTEDLTGGEPAHEPRVALDGGGNAILVWTGFNENYTASAIYARRFTRSGAPDLLITSPTDAVTNRREITVGGWTDPGVRLTISGRWVPVSSKGAFASTTTLPDGSHSFEVVATSADGGTRKATVGVTVDTAPPTLRLVGPADGTTVDTPTANVVGMTEPGARVVVNGVAVTVAPDGSFSTSVALQEGANILRATATDGAGNTATQTVTVTYANPLPGEIEALQQQLAFVSSVAFVGLISFAAAFAIFLLLLKQPWKRRPMAILESQRPPSLAETKEVTDETSPSSEAARTNRLSVSAVQKHWPTGNAAANGVRLIAKERILLHLLHFVRYTEAPELPPELTQDRIAEAAGIDRRHFTQYSRPLVHEGLVEGRSAHVRGSLQRRKVYVLTDEGRRKAMEIRDRLRSVTIRMRDASGERNATIAEALLEARGTKSVLDILRESMETGIVDLR